MYTRGLGQTTGDFVGPVQTVPPDVLLAQLQNLPLTGPYTGASSGAIKQQDALSLALTPAPVASGFSVMDWISAHSSYAVIGGGILLALLLFGGRRR